MEYTKFTIRTTKPVSADKYIKCYNTTASGGWSEAIKGKPTDPECDVLSNCVGYAQGRFCEIYDEIMDTVGNKYKYLNCNAENFVERCQKTYPELEMGDDPRPGAIMCWQKGPTTSSSDGAGHVAVVEKVIDKDTVLTSESAWGSTTPFYSKTRKRGDTNNWGQPSAFSFRAFIYNPAVEEIPIELVTPTDRNESVDQIQVIPNGTQRIRSSASLTADVLGSAQAGYYNYFDTETADGYTWYKLAEEQWIAGVGSRVVVLPKKVKYHITIKPTDNGTVSATTLDACAGEEVNLTITPETGYELVYIKLNDKELNGTSFTMPASNVLLEAEFRLKTFMVTWKTGSRETSQIYKYGETPVFTGDVEKKSDGKYTYAFAGWMPEIQPVTVDAKYVARYKATEINPTGPSNPSMAFYRITVDLGIVHGQVSLSRVMALQGDTITVLTISDPGYTLDYITVNSEKIEGNSFSMPGENAVVGAIFVAEPVEENLFMRLLKKVAEIFKNIFNKKE